MDLSKFFNFGAINFGSVFRFFEQLLALVFTNETVLDAGGQIPVDLQLGTRNGRPLKLVGNIVEVGAAPAAGTPPAA